MSFSTGSGVSVIIPVRNAEACLGRAVTSALEQTAAPAEIIVVNDGSTDNSAQTAKNFREKIVYIEQENQGPAAARNRGIETAKGEFVAFLDADDYWLPGFLEQSIRFLREQPQAIAVSVGLRFCVGKKTVEKPHAPEIPQTPTILKDFFEFWSKYDHIRTGAAVVRSSTVAQAGGQRETLRVAEDLEYWGYLATFGLWGFIPETLWVGDSLAAAAQDWTEKYRDRRRLAPTVEEWQERLVERLSPGDWPGFIKMRGKVAANLAHHHLLAGNTEQARHIFSNYRKDMPSLWTVLLMRFAQTCGTPGWRSVGFLLDLRERQKAFRLRTAKGCRGTAES